MNNTIVEIAEKRVKEFLEIDIDEKGFKQKKFENKMKQAIVGMRFKQNEEVMERIGRGQIIRVVSLISVNNEERKEYIKDSMPKLVQIK